MPQKTIFTKDRKTPPSCSTDTPNRLIKIVPGNKKIAERALRKIIPLLNTQIICVLYINRLNSRQVAVPSPQFSPKDKLDHEHHNLL